MTQFAANLRSLIDSSSKKRWRIGRTDPPRFEAEALELRLLLSSFGGGPASIASVVDPVTAGGTETISFSIAPGFHSEFVFCSDALTTNVTLDGVDQTGFGDVSAASNPPIYNFLPSPTPLPGAMIFLGGLSGSHTATFPIDPGAAASTSGDMSGAFAVVTGYATSITGPKIFSAATSFGVLAAAAPAVTQVTPSAGPVAGGALEMISGSGFSSPAQVFFGGTQALNVKVINSTTIVCTKPPGAAGTVDVSVSDGGGFSATSSADQFTYDAIPTVTGIGPNTGSIMGNTTVTITGSNFTTPATVNFGTLAATNVKVVSSTQITATSPMNWEGPVDVTVQTPGGTSPTTSLDTYTYVGGPAITSISPAMGVVTGNTPVTITGTGFSSPAIVAFGISAATNVQVISSTQITCNTPASPTGMPGTVDVAVMTSGGMSPTSSSDQYQYLGLPTVSKISPAGGPLAGNTMVTITGTNFSNGATVNFGSTAATSVTVVSPTMITCTSPAETAGVVDVLVTTAAGASAKSTNDNFTYADVPTVTAISPTGGPLAGNTMVTITGTNFVSGATVMFGNTAATSATVVSPTMITCMSPMAASSGDVDVTVATVGGTSATSFADQFTYFAVPAVTMINPSIGPLAGNTSVLISGTDFNGATTVKFGTVASPNVVIVSNFLIDADSPTGMAGAVDVTVTTPGGTSMTSAADKFTYAGIPTVTMVSPTVGPVAGNTAVTITGTNFVAGAMVLFGNTPATNVKVVSATQITATSPANGAGTVDVTVLTVGGTSAVVSADKFRYAALPTVSAVSPATCPLAGGGNVTLTGTGFTGATAVNFGATAATSVKVVSDTQITAVIPASKAAGAVDVTVVTPGGTSAAIAADKFTYFGVPTITNVSPSAGPLQGIGVTLTGTNFTGATAVLFGTTPATTFTVVSATQVTATAPAGVAGTVNITVTSPGGTSAVSSADQFRYAAPPTITKISPAAGPLGGGTAVTITGTNLTGATAVLFDSTPAKSFTVVSSTQVIVTSPPGGPGPVDVTVVTPGGTSTVVASDQFTYFAAPLITSISPAAGPTAGGTVVTINGANFTGATAVNFGTFPATGVKVVSPSQVTAISPAGVAATVDITVVTPGGTSVTSPVDKYRYASQPTITSISPASGPLAGGNVVTITGTNFTGATAVHFGSTLATTFTVVSATQITATAPAGVAGAVDITVTSPGGTTAASLADEYTYTVSVPAPAIVGSPVINGDNPNGLFTAAGQPSAGAQRSMVEDVVYTFNEAVTIPNADAAFTVLGTGPNPGTAPTTLTATAVPGSNGTQWAVTLTGAAAGVLGSIANGEYSITINPSAVFAAADGVTQLAAGRTDQFYRLFGDIDGAEAVNAADNLQFKKALTTYNPAFDSNADGTVNAADNLAFKKDLTVAYFGDGFVPTI